MDPSRWTTALALLILVSAAPIVAQANPSLFTSIDPADGVTVSPASIAEHAVDVDISSLETATVLNINLPDGTVLPATATGIEQRGADNYTWRGSLMADTGIDATITVLNGTVAGLIHTPDGAYQIIPGAGGSHRLAKLDHSLFPDCGGATHPALGVTGDPKPGVSVGPQEGGTSVIEVMALYTDDTRAAAGGTAAIEATNQAATDNTNTAYMNSGVNIQMNLIHQEEVAFTETGNIFNDLSTARNNTAYQQIRDAVGADMVGLVTENGGGFCGVATSIQNNPGPAFAPSAWQLTARACAVGNLTWAHEFGHLQGLQHDPANGQSPAVAAFPWAFGHFHSGQYRTVMSYSNQCSGGCTRVTQFSNANINFMSLPTGIADQRENYRVLNFTAPIIADFYENDDVFTDGFEAGNTTAWSATVIP